MSYTDLQYLSATEFKRLCGVSRETFAQMIEVLRPQLERVGRRGGQNKLSTEDQLLITLEYWREYRSQFHIGTSWGLHETTVGRMIRKVENLLIKCGKFRLPSQRALYQPGWERKVMVVDVGEMEIERPKKNKNAITVVSNTAFALKAQLLVEFETGQVVCTAYEKGRVHDFKLLKRSRLPFVPSQLCLADKGYQGFGKRHKGACLPTKKPRNQPLPAAEKQHNRALSRLRVRALTRHPSIQDFSHFFGTLSQSQKTVWLALKSDCGSAQL